MSTICYPAEAVVGSCGESTPLLLQEHMLAFYQSDTAMDPFLLLHNLVQLLGAFTAVRSISFTDTRFESVCQ